MRTLLRVAVAVAIVAVIGFLVARASRGTGGGSGPSAPALSRHAATASFRVSYPANWHRLSAPPAGLLPSLSAPLALAPKGTGQEMLIGTMSAGGSSAGQLLSAVGPTDTSGSSVQIVSLGGQQFYRDLNLSLRGQGVTESIYLLDTTKGTIGAVCAAQKPSQSFTATCERVLATLRLTSGSVLAARVDAGYAQALNAVVTKLNAARSGLGPKLSSGSLQSRAQAAQQLATAHAQAAASAFRLSPGESGLAATNRVLVSALRQTAAAYQALGRAISDRRQAAYRSAEAQIAASAGALDSVYTRLRGLGYRIG
jgi:hypothetical protein